jgi:hypothetical protein
MERSSKRGKIPQQDWPSIIKRYEVGETLASIARTYDCSPPAISYILSRSRARDVAAEATERSGIASSEPGLVKGRANDMPTAEVIPGMSETGEAAAPTRSTHAPDPIDEASPEPSSVGPDPEPNRTERTFDREVEITVAAASSHPANRYIEEPVLVPLSANGNSPQIAGATGAQPQPEEPRRTLHLSLPHNSGQRIETLHHDGRSVDVTSSAAVLPVVSLQEGLTPQHLARQNPAPHASANNGGADRSVAEPDRVRDGGAFIDRALRERVDGDITAFLAAFDAALAGDTVESRAMLREATDRLLRAGARTRIELERLEARIPLPARDTGGHRTSNWRPR